MTRLLRADNEAALQEALHAATWRDFNEQTNNGATVGFYPFVFSFDPATIETAAGGGGTCVAHGANAAFVGKTLSEMVVQTNVGDAAVGKNLGQSFAEAALDAAIERARKAEKRYAVLLRSAPKGLSKSKRAKRPRTRKL